MTRTTLHARRTWPTLTGVAAVLGLSVFVSSCSTTVDIKKASISQVSSEPGAFYALPKTELGISVAATLKKKKNGFYNGKDTELKGAALAKCIKDCDCVAKGDGDKDPGSDLTVKTVTVTPRALPDLDQLYRVNVSPGGIFISANHTMSFNEALTLTKGTAEIKNQTSDFVVDVLTKSAIIAGKAFAAAQQPPGGPKPPGKCANVGDPIVQDLTHVKQRLGQPKVDSSGDLAFSGGTLDKQVDALNEAKTRLACGGKPLAQCALGSGDSSGMTAAQAQLDAALQKLETERGELTGLFARGATDSSQDVTLEGFIPANAISSTHASSKADIVKALSKEKSTEEDLSKDPDPLIAAAVTSKTVIAPPIIWLGENANKIATAAKLKTFIIWSPANNAAPASAKDKSDTTATASETKAGYRYRIPVFTDVAVYRDKNAVALTHAAVAQLGVVGALPADFQGKASSSTVELFELTGSPKTLAVSNTAVDTTQPMSVVNAAYDAYAAKAAAADAKATAAADAAKAVNQFKSEKDELSALNDVCKLRAQLGKSMGTECAAWKP